MKRCLISVCTLHRCGRMRRVCHLSHFCIYAEVAKKYTHTFIYRSLCLELVFVELTSLNHYVFLNHFGFPLEPICACEVHL